MDNQTFRCRFVAEFLSKEHLSTIERAQCIDAFYTEHLEEKKEKCDRYQYWKLYLILSVIVVSTFYVIMYVLR